MLSQSLGEILAGLFLYLIRGLSDLLEISVCFVINAMMSLIFNDFLQLVRYKTLTVHSNNKNSNTTPICSLSAQMLMKNQVKYATL